MINFGKMAVFLRRVLMIMLPFLLAILFLGFWTVVLTSEVPLVELIQSPGFLLRVVINIVPAMAVMAAVLWLAGRFVSGVYKLDGARAGFQFLLYSRCGQPGFAPWMRIEKGKPPDDGDTLIKIGGPGNLVIYADSAVVLQKGGRLTRVVGPGYQCLESFEKIYDVIDLRPKRYCYNVSAMTKEGIPIDWQVEVHYKIADDGAQPTREVPYPYSDTAVARAATCQWRREPSFRFGQDMDWEGLVVVSRTEGTLRSILARRTLDELIGLGEKEEQAARESIRAELKTELEKKVPALGARLLDVRLDNLKVKDDVTQEWIKAWKAQWQEWSARKLAPSEAEHVHLQEVAKAEAQMRLIQSIATALGHYLDERRITAQTVNRIVLMRLFSVMDRASMSSSARVFFPAPATEMLERMRGLMPPPADEVRGELESGEGGDAR